eukprot:snap_masked-scaffold_37-processed-gene-1.11-mRNA-1 protein AED:1.00 eAED:1.00 QI:0/0/0/0/1/1/2/0/59
MFSFLGELRVVILINTLFGFGINISEELWDWYFDLGILKKKNKPRMKKKDTFINDLARD